MTGGFVYTIGRFLGVGTRPLALFVANNYFHAQTAEGIAVAFLASSLALISVGASPHRRYYARYFSTDGSVNGLPFYLYAVSLLLLGMLGCVTACAITWHFASSIALTVAVSAYFVSEVIADEVLRLRLFETELEMWGRLTLKRSALQLGAVGVLVAIFTDVSSWLIIFLFAVSNFAAFLPCVPGKLWINLSSRGLHTIGWLVRRAGRSVAQNWVVWAIALIGSSVAYLDRIVALFLDKATLPLFMLVAMCFSVVPLAVDFFYVSRYRRDFLDRRISVTGAFRHKLFVASFGAGLLLASAASVAVLHFSNNGQSFPWGYVVVIAVLQASMALGMIPREVLYWSSAPARILQVEILFWVLFASGAVICWFANVAAMGALVLVAACALIRLAIYVFASVRGTQDGYATI